VPGGALRLPLIFAACTIAAGVLDSFLPLAKGVSSNLSSAALLVTTISATLSRWQAGRHGDRYGHARLLVPALIMAALGMAAMIWLSSPALVFVSMVLFGAGFGVIENATFALLIERLPEAKASALWNLSYDAGYGAGPAAFGLVAARTGYPAAFAMTGVLMLAVLPAALRERKAAPVPDGLLDEGGAPGEGTSGHVDQGEALVEVRPLVTCSKASERCGQDG
jgi:MFS family permease